jgi:hypothetical protein
VPLREPTVSGVIIPESVGDDPDSAVTAPDPDEPRVISRAAVLDDDILDREQGA